MKAIILDGPPEWIGFEWEEQDPPRARISKEIQVGTYATYGGSMPNLRDAEYKLYCINQGVAEYRYIGHN